MTSTSKAEPSAIEVHDSGENIFADIGVADPDAHYLKAQIVAELYRLSTERALTQAATGRLLGISQPEVSRLFKGNFREYSVERLIGFMTSFGRDIEIVAKPRRADAKGPRGLVTFTP
jgi:predicted XRE-type DNA-binding protein